MDKATLINYGAGFVLALAVLRILARVLTKSSADIVVELRELRGDIKVSAAAQNLAITTNTDRVSRIEGKIEGLVMALAPKLSDNDPDEITETHAIPEPHIEPESTPIEVPPSVHRKRAARPHTPVPIGAYHLKKQR